MTTATYMDVGVALGRPITDPDEQAQIDYWLGDVEMQIRVRLGDLTALDQDVLKRVEVKAVSAWMQNPNGYQSETIDDYTYRFGSETRNVTILDEWWELLRPTTRSAGFSTRPGFEPDRLSVDPWRLT